MNREEVQELSRKARWETEVKATRAGLEADPFESGAEDDLVAAGEREKTPDLSSSAFSTSRYPRILAIVGALAVAGFIYGYMSLTSKDAPATETKPSPEPATSIPKVEPDPERQKIDDLKGQLAFERQRNDLAERREKKPEAEHRPLANPTPPPRPSATSLPVRVIYRNTPAPPPRIETRTVFQTVRVPSPTPTPVSPPDRSALSPAHAPVDPAKRWAESAAIGAFGTEENSSVAATPAPEAERETVPVSSAEEEPILRGRPVPVATIPAGTSVRGVLETPISRSDDEKLNGESEYAVRLLQPLVGRDDKMIAPVNSLLIVRATIASNGLIATTPERLLAIDSGGEREIPLQGASISLRKEGGAPLIARRETSIGRGRSLDPGTLAIGIAQTALPFLSGGGNNSDSFEQFYRMQQLQNFYERNFAPERGIEERNELQDPRLVTWTINAGEKIVIYFNRAIRVRGEDNP
jgi:hypothetical protein